ncbi:hypothetical protein FJNA_15510 [Thermus sp. FJN-A]
MPMKKHLVPILLFLLPACVPTPERQTPPTGEPGVPPFPDARFALYLDPEALRQDLPTLPIPPAEAVRRGPLGFPLLLAFLGTAPTEGYGVRLGRVAQEGGTLRVEVQTWGPAGPQGKVRYTYPLDLRPIANLPPFPFELVFHTPEGRVLHRERVRPRVAPHGRAEEVGDPYGVVARWEEVYRDGPYLGRNLVRLHEEAFEVFYTPEEEESRFYLDLPSWLFGGREDPSCALTDRPPEALVQEVRGSLLEGNLTLRGAFVPLNRRYGLAHSPLPPEEVPERAYVACFYTAHDPRPEALGPLVLDLYPARLLPREPGSVEVLRAEAGPTELFFQIRLHPLPREDVPLDLYTLDPPPLPGGERVAVFPYPGFDRDPTQPRYVLGLGGGQEGFFLWILAPEVHTFTLFARLVRCQGVGGGEVSALNPPPGAGCPSLPLAQASYTHRGLLGPGGPLTLRLQFRSPEGWRSEPFAVTVP